MCALFFLSCSEDAGEPSSEVSLGLDNYCFAYHEALCERQVGCNTALSNQATTITDCMERATALCSPKLITWTRSVEEGLADFDTAKLGQCRADLLETSCKTLASGRRPLSCREVFTGPVAPGGECFTDVECEGSSLCAAFGRCPGVCQALENDPEDVNCTLTGCADDMFCDGSICQARLSEGASCPGLAQACDTGLFCGKDVDDPALLCRARKAEGEVCFSRVGCLDGLSCQGQGTRTCLPEKGQGSACQDLQECGQGLICDQSLGTCGPPKAEEASCVSTFDCEEGLYCWQEFDPAPDRGICREEGKVGIGLDQPCNPATDRCRLGLYCRIGDQVEVGQCAVLPDLGESCADFSRNLNEECRTGECRQVDGEAECIMLGDTGDACTASAQCLSLSCQEGQCAPFEAVFCSP